MIFYLKSEIQCSVFHIRIQRNPEHTALRSCDPITLLHRCDLNLLITADFLCIQPRQCNFIHLRYFHRFLSIIFHHGISAQCCHFLHIVQGCKLFIRNAVRCSIGNWQYIRIFRNDISALLLQNGIARRHLILRSQDIAFSHQLCKQRVPLFQ